MRTLGNSLVRFAGVALVVVSAGNALAQEEVTFADANLEAAVREAIGKPTGDILQSDVAGLTDFDASGRGIESLAGIERLTALRGLYLRRNQISDVGPLSGLVALTGLYLDDNKISDVGPLSGLTALRRLYLRRNQISDVGPLSGLTALGSLDLRDNQISELGPLSRLTALTCIGLSGNQVSDVGPLSGLVELTGLYLDNNKISDVGPLSGLTRLRTLMLAQNQISDVGPLSGLTELSTLDLQGNQITDVGPLSGLTQLTDLKLADNQISDLTPLSGLTQLTWLELRWNLISDVSGLTELAELRLLYLDGNQIQGLSALAELPRIGDAEQSWRTEERDGIEVHLGLSNNLISDTAALVDNAGLGESDGIDLRGNALNDEAYEAHIPALEARGVELLHDSQGVGVAEQEAGTPLPATYALYPNAPNPFNPVTSVAYDLPEAVQVCLCVHNGLGQRIATLVVGPAAAVALHGSVERRGMRKRGVLL